MASQVEGRASAKLLSRDGSWPSHKAVREPAWPGLVISSVGVREVGTSMGRSSGEMLKTLWWAWRPGRGGGETKDLVGV